MTSSQHPYPGRWPVILALWAFAAGVVLFWISFFGEGAVRPSDDACYIVFERNFVAADLVTAAAGLICAEGLRRGKDWAIVWGGVAAGGILFLLCMDVTWNLLHGLYANLTGAMLTENAINLFCVTFAPYLIWYLLRHGGRPSHA